MTEIKKGRPPRQNKPITFTVRLNNDIQAQILEDLKVIAGETGEDLVNIARSMLKLGIAAYNFGAGLDKNGNLLFPSHVNIEAVDNVEQSEPLKINNISNESVELKPINPKISKFVE